MSWTPARSAAPVCSAIAVALGLGCSGRPQLTRGIAERWGCSYNAVRRVYGELHSDLPAGDGYAPEMGWSACEALAHLGPPDSVERDSAGVSWLYPAPADRAVGSRRWRAVYFDSTPGEGWSVLYDTW